MYNSFLFTVKNVENDSFYYIRFILVPADHRLFVFDTANIRMKNDGFQVKLSSWGKNIDHVCKGLKR